jgi:hypothetical protein
MKRCRSNPAATVGAVAPAAAHAVTGRGRGRARPFGARAAYDAADVVWPDTRMPREIAVAGIVFDMMPGHLSPRPAVVAKWLRVQPETVGAFLAVWECVEPGVRFDAVRRAVAIARVRRLSRGCKSCRG